MPFVVFAAPFSSPEFCFHLPAHYNAPALHCVISLLSCNASWNTTGYGVWSWWWGKTDSSSSHGTASSLSSFLLALTADAVVNMRVTNNLSLRSTLVWKTLLTARFFYTATSLLKWPPPCSAWVEMAVVLISKDLFIVVFIPSPVEQIAVLHLSLFFISIFLFIHVQQDLTLSPSLLLTLRRFHTGLWYLLSAKDETLTPIICLLSHCFAVFGVSRLHTCPRLVFNREY